MAYDSLVHSLFKLIKQVDCVWQEIEYEIDTSFSAFGGMPVCAEAVHTGAKSGEVSYTQVPLRLGLPETLSPKVNHPKSSVETLKPYFLSFIFLALVICGFRCTGRMFLMFSMFSMLFSIILR